VLNRLVAVTDAIYLAKDREHLFEALASGCASLGFDGFNLFCHKATKHDMVLDATLTNFSSSFFKDYEYYDWSDSDFLLDDLVRSRQPVSWHTEHPRYEEIAKQSFIDFLHTTKMRTGLVTPLKHRPATTSALSMTSTTIIALEDGFVQTITVMANAAMTKAEILGLCPEVSADAARAAQLLSVIQLEILSWIAEGKSNLDIATIVGLNERGVRYHVTEILRKLGVATRAQAAAIRKAPGFDPKQ